MEYVGQDISRKERSNHATKMLASLCLDVRLKSILQISGPDPKMPAHIYCPKCINDVLATTMLLSPIIACEVPSRKIWY